MKKVWLTSLVSSEGPVKNVMAQLKTYGLEVDGSFWEDDLDKMSWIKPRDQLIDSKVALWLILASHEDLSTPSVRYGLSLLAITVQAQRGLGFPIVILLTQGEAVSSESLSTPLKGSDCLSLMDAGFGAKLVAKVHGPVKEIASDYCLDAYGNPQIGQWFEVGPSKSRWIGAMFGVEGAKIAFHAVGPKGRLPSRSTLNYPVKDMEVTLGDKKYRVWAVQNELEPKDSYFLKVEGISDSVIFGPYSREEEAEVYVLHLK
jgi:hypothetical protein